MLMSRKEDDEGNDDMGGTGGEATGFGGAMDTPCQRMKGIYEFRQASNELPDSLTSQPTLKRLPLTIKAFEMLRGTMLERLSQDYTDGSILIDALKQVSKMPPEGAAFEEMTCDWTDSKMSGRLKEVYDAAETLMYQIMCFNQFGVWTPAVGNNLPVTKEFYDYMYQRMSNIKAANPGISRANAVLDALEGGQDTSYCEWRGSAMENFSDRQRDVMEATGVIFDQVSNP